MYTGLAIKIIRQKHLLNLILKIAPLSEKNTEEKKHAKAFSFQKDRAWQFLPSLSCAYHITCSQNFGRGHMLGLAMLLKAGLITGKVMDSKISWLNFSKIFIVNNFN